MANETYSKCKQQKFSSRALRPEAGLAQNRIFCETYLENSMDFDSKDNQPIYRQLRERVVALILDGILKEGEPLPSVRSVAAEHGVNPLTVLKCYQQLVDEQLIEKRRGLGMFVKTGARNLLFQGERRKFLAEEWPRIYATIQRLRLLPKELLSDHASRREAMKNGRLGWLKKER